MADQQAHALVIGRIQPEHAVEDAPGFLETAQPPKAQPEAVHAAQEWPVVNPTPWEHAVETFAEG